MSASSRIRVCTDVDGEPWSVAKDVCAALGIANPADTLRRWLDRDETGLALLYDPKGDQMLPVVSNSGLLALVLRSPLPQARHVRRGLTEGRPLARLFPAGWWVEEMQPQALAVSLQAPGRCEADACRRAQVLDGMARCDALSLRQAAAYLRARVEVAFGRRAPAAALYRDYQAWLTPEQRPGLSLAAFGEALALLHAPMASEGALWYSGVRLLPAKSQD